MGDTRQSRTVLVVEDDPDISDAIAQVLEDHDYVAKVAENGATALAQLRASEHKPCVILLDLMMPVMDGVRFRTLQRDDPSLRSIPVVVLSAHARAGAIAQELDAAGFIGKPVELVDLLATVRRFCPSENERVL